MKTKLSSVIVCLVLSLACVIMPAFALVSSAAGDAQRVTLPEAPEAPEDGYKFVGWSTETCEGTQGPSNYVAGGATVEITKTTTYYPIFKKETTTTTESDKFTLITDVNDLVAGMKVIIAAKGYDYALSTTQNGNNRGTETITKSGNTLAAPSTSVEILTLEAGTITGTFAFKATAGYLYAASSGSNYLRSEETKSNNSSWAITIASDGTATVKAQGSNTRNWMRYNNSSKIFAAYASGQQDIVLYGKLVTSTTAIDYKTSTNDAVTAQYIDNCEHPNQITTEVKPTSLTPGYKEVVCENCHELISREDYEALGCTVNFSVPVGAEVPASLPKVFEVDLPETVEVPTIYDKYDYEFSGWKANDGTIYEGGAKVTLTGDTTFTAVFKYIAGTTIVYGTEYVKKDFEEVTSSDVVVIATLYNGVYYTLSSANGTSASPAKTLISVNNNVIAAKDVNANILWNIVKGEDSFVINPNGNSAKWLYCTASSATTVRVGDNTNKTFTYDKGYLKHIGTGKYIGAYNNGSDWRCYTSIHDNIKNQTLAFFVESEVEKVVDDVQYTSELESKTALRGASITLGSSLAMNFYVKAGTGFNPDNYTVDFSMVNVNGDPVTMDGVVLAQNTNGYYASFTGIAPQCMGMAITATLYENGVEVDSYTYSIKEYAEDLYETADEDTKTVLSALLTYGAAAQMYKAYDVENLVTDGFELIDTTETTPAETTVTVNNTTAAVYIKSAGVRFDYDQKVYVKLAVAEDVEGEIVVTINGEEVDVTDNIAYSAGISAADFDAAVEVVVTLDGEVVATLTYSVNAYAYNMYNNANASENTKELVRAMYAYGFAVENYNN